MIDSAFKIIMCFSLGCFILSGAIMGWIGLIHGLKSLIKHLTRPYDPSRDYKNPLRR